MSNKKEVLTIKKGSLNSRESLIGFLVIVFLVSFAAFSNLKSKIDDLSIRLVQSDLKLKILAKSIREDKIDWNKAKFVYNVKHTVEIGESLGSIAELYSVTAEDIRSFNEMSSSELLNVGQVINLPLTYTKDDETMNFDRVSNYKYYTNFLLDKITSLENDITFLEITINEESKIPSTTKDDLLYLFTELGKLKTSVNDIKNQKKIIENNSVVNNVSSSDKYKYKSNWRKLSIGMSRQRVRAILGEPDKINVNYFENWFYPKGTVKFSTGRDFLYEWSEPNWN